MINLTTTRSNNRNKINQKHFKSISSHNDDKVAISNFINFKKINNNGRNKHVKKNQFCNKNNLKIFKLLIFLWILFIHFF